ncbi:protein LURP-one-related 7 isoform X2 [Ananas comosus]|uniref:Protein LURP-one-related 7 isoform X2 n=1 Tax=Ananas comosus TaxID=4615 RepID=A0A6P5EXB9_ANACO|nr:protein LURP-one-related 7 isoform X2 [Ananas comosus]
MRDPRRLRNYQIAPRPPHRAGSDGPRRVRERGLQDQRRMLRRLTLLLLRTRPHQISLRRRGVSLGLLPPPQRKSPGEWRAFKGDSLELKDTIFTVRNASASASKVELDVYLRDENIEDPKPSFRLKGNPFRRSCTIVRENTIVAQACLLYKLRKFVYWRHKFRLTVYPGNDHILVIAMLVTFFGGSRRAEIGNCICCIFGT